LVITVIAVLSILKWYFVAFRIGSGFNQVSGSGYGIRIRIQEGKNDPQKLKKVKKFYDLIEVQDVLS
jgi:hypothetical protein